MRLVTKWWLTSIGGGVLITAGLFALPGLFLASAEEHTVAGKVLEAVFWPVAVCVYLSGSGVPIGPPEKHMYEATPVQVIAAVLGIGLSWALYSSLGFLIFWLRHKWCADSRPASSARYVDQSERK